MAICSLWGLMGGHQALGNLMIRGGFSEVRSRFVLGTVAPVIFCIVHFILPLVGVGVAERHLPDRFTCVALHSSNHRAERPPPLPRFSLARERRETGDVTTVAEALVGLVFDAPAQRGDPICHHCGRWVASQAAAKRAHVHVFATIAREKLDARFTNIRLADGAIPHLAGVFSLYSLQLLITSGALPISDSLPPTTRRQRWEARSLVFHVLKGRYALANEVYVLGHQADHKE
mmetsp:Transcript_112470/g.281744  ORF Transcript_112470/g.281744 Transcript_112470/m.281744 type:complete len:232 (-) Transcript_112470:490-1185(-)